MWVFLCLTVLTLPETCITIRLIQTETKEKGMDGAILVLLCIACFISGAGMMSNYDDEKVIKGHPIIIEDVIYKCEKEVKDASNIN
jgi:hypothetical protein